MDAKLNDLTQRYDQVTNELGNPAVASDPKRYQELAKVHAELRPIVESYQELLALRTQISENETLVKDAEDPELAELAKEELPALKAAATTLTEDLQVLLLPKDPDNDKNCIIEIRAGTGGDEAGLFAAELMHMYQRYAETSGLRMETLNLSDTEVGGIKEAVLLVSGPQAFGKLKFESGVHRVQRIPKTESGGRIHTSAVTVAIMCEAEDVDIEINDSDLRIDTYRSSGAGGQHVNTTDSAVRITHGPTGVVVTCSDERSQIKNRAKAMKVLRSRIYEAQQQKLKQERSAARKSLVGSGDRSEKIRTYNFPQGRVTDHRIGKTIHQLDAFLAGDIGGMIDALLIEERTELMKQAGQS